MILDAPLNKRQAGTANCWNLALGGKYPAFNGLCGWERFSREGSEVEQSH